MKGYRKLIGFFLGVIFHGFCLWKAGENNYLAILGSFSAFYAVFIGGNHIEKKLEGSKNDN